TRLSGPASPTEISVAPHTVTLQLGGAATVATYDPLLGTSPTRVSADVTSVQISVPDHAVLVEIVPPGASATIDPGAAPSASPGGVTVGASPEPLNVTFYADSVVVEDSVTGAIVQTLPPVSGDSMRFVSIDGQNYGLNLASAESLGLDPTQLRDYAGNNLGSGGSWQMKGLASVRNLAAPSYILSNPANGRWAEVAPQPDGSFNFANHGADGDTRVVGIYIDPLVQSGVVQANSPFDSQVRFASDVKADRLAALGSLPDPTQAGIQDLLFKLTNHAADHHDDV